MATDTPIEFRFASQRLGNLRRRLLENQEMESFAVLLGRRSVFNKKVVRVVGARFPRDCDLISRGRGHVTPSKDYIHRLLDEISGRIDVDSIIDVHTHPFSASGVRFSHIDDGDERQFCTFLAEYFPRHLYGSIVFSQQDYEARTWTLTKAGPVSRRATLRSQTSSDNIFESGNVSDLNEGGSEMFDRAQMVLGLPALRKIMSDQTILIAGLGGLGSVLAETLVQMGFQRLILVDPDKVELSNLSRLAGPTFRDAQRGMSKVAAIRRHLRQINPKARIQAIARPIEDIRVRRHAAASHWIMVCTDNHSSRLHAQKLSHELFVPLISVGVNITVEGDVVTDESGEVITCINGSGACLLCTGRVNLTKVFHESHPSEHIRSELVNRGYVSGTTVAEPAVRTLNSILAAMAADTLVDHYTGRRPSEIIRVYENNGSPRMFSDLDTVPEGDGCYSCDISENWE